MKKMKSLKGGLAGILFTAGLLAASCTSDQSSSAVTIVKPPRLYTNQRKLCRKPLATETDEFH